MQISLGRRKFHGGSLYQSAEKGFHIQFMSVQTVVTKAKLICYDDAKTMVTYLQNVQIQNSGSHFVERQSTD